jgi:hypothetical protein
VQVVEGHVEIAPHRIPQLGPVQAMREGEERSVDHGGVDRGAAFRVLAIRVEVDALGQPLLDPRRVARVRKQIVEG